MMELTGRVSPQMETDQTQRQKVFRGWGLRASGNADVRRTSIPTRCHPESRYEDETSHSRCGSRHSACVTVCIRWSLTVFPLQDDSTYLDGCINSIVVPSGSRT